MRLRESRVGFVDALNARTVAMMPTGTKARFSRRIQLGEDWSLNMYHAKNPAVWTARTAISRVPQSRQSICDRPRLAIEIRLVDVAVPSDTPPETATSVPRSPSPDRRDLAGLESRSGTGIG